MRILGQIMKYDWRNLSADRTLWAVASVLLLAIGYGAWNGASWVRFQRNTLSAAAAEEDERLRTIKRDIVEADAGRVSPPVFLDPRSPAAVGRRLGSRYAAMPPAPLASLAIGQSDLYPYYFRVSTGSKDTFINNDEIEHPVHLLSGRFDLAFVVLYLYPLLILALGYNLLSAEKEAGTLALTLSQPVGLRKLVLGKVALRFTFVLTLAVGLSLAGVAIGGSDLTSAETAVRLALWIGIVAAYGAFWFALAVGVNALGASSATNAMALSCIWLALVLVIPSLLNVGVKVAHPVPSRVELINSMREASSDASAQGSKLLARYLEDHPELAVGGETKGDFYTIGVAVQQEVEKKMQPVMAEFDRQLDNQQALLDRYRYISPAIVAQAALNDIAGSGVHRYKHFVRLADDFHSEWRAWFVPRILKRERLTRAVIEELPSFRFREEPVSDAAERSLTALAGLTIPAIVVAVISLALLRRYPIIG
jgi:ABC-2 type transport system permease protein